MSERTKRDVFTETSHPIVVACIPALNEEKTIARVILGTRKYVDRVVVCDDGSTDMTGEIAEALGAFVVRHERNRGYGAAICALFDEACLEGADIMVTLDADNQHDPEDIPRLLERLGEGDVDIVLGSRFLEGGSCEAPGWRKSGIKLITGLASRSGLKVTDAQSGFRAYNKRALDVLKLTEQGMGVSTEILLKAEENGLNVSEVPIRISPCESSSTHNPVVQGLDVVLSTVKHYSIRRPMLFYGLPGVISLWVSLVFWVWTLDIFTKTRSIVTNIALIALGTMLIGLMLLITGIILWVTISVVQEATKRATNSL